MEEKRFIFLSSANLARIDNAISNSNYKVIEKHNFFPNNYSGKVGVSITCVSKAKVDDFGFGQDYASLMGNLSYVCKDEALTLEKYIEDGAKRVILKFTRVRD